MGKTSFKLTENLFGIVTEHDRIRNERHTPDHGVHTVVEIEHVLPCRPDIFRGIGCRVAVGGSGCHPHLHICFAMGPESGNGSTVGFQHIVHRAQEFPIAHTDSRSMFSAQISKAQKTLGFIDGKKVFHPVAQSLGNQFCIFVEPIYNLVILPSAPALEFIGKIPVIQCHIGLDIVGK